MAEFAKLVGDADLAKSRLVQRKRDQDGLDLWATCGSSGIAFRRVSSCSANSPPAP
jgi:hypothetical protein